MPNFFIGKGRSQPLAIVLKLLCLRTAGVQQYIVGLFRNLAPQNSHGLTPRVRDWAESRLNIERLSTQGFHIWNPAESQSIAGFAGLGHVRKPGSLDGDLRVQLQQIFPPVITGSNKTALLQLGNQPQQLIDNVFCRLFAPDCKHPKKQQRQAVSGHRRSNTVCNPGI